MAEPSNLKDEAKRSLIFTYGSLKRGFPNHTLTQDLISHKDAAYVGDFVTHQPIPLVIGPYGIPYIINDLPGSGHRIKGELYTVTGPGLVRLDDLEGIAIGHYERLPIQVVRDLNDDDDDVVSAEAYFAHRSFGHALWERNGRESLREYSEIEGRRLVMKQDRPDHGRSILEDIRLFLASSDGK
ncbi:putative gamma-glutamylcyclotransferase At3g02910 [Humulus lupulus]|uniref:putative gamma-glutamylcyclotransferase At3g02910 n=1 Tax=Humulus lupulus TaxID=3486 RepID=UPI002B401FE8|nr:putative gamma-glutamylcyclotransferase At3g02910 [Humulus lupulus]